MKRLPLPTRLLSPSLLQRLFLTSCFLLLLAPTAVASYIPGNQSAPRTSGPPTGRRGGGCSNDDGTPLTALAPQTHVGQTSSSHPTLAWFIPNTDPMPMELQIYRYTGSTQTLVKQVNFQSQPGIMQWTLPTDDSGLVVGEQYRWQVVLFCNPNRPSSALVAGAELAVVAAPVVKAPDSPLQQVEQYANAGLWYDALQAALSDHSSVASQQLATLLETLSNLEQTSGDAWGQEQADQLSQVIKMVSHSQFPINTNAAQ